MEKIKVGDILYEELKHEIKSRIVTKIGKKYFYIDNDRHGFSLNDLKYEDNMYIQFNRSLYRSEQEIKDRNRIADLLWKLRLFFSDRTLNKNVTLQQLESITKILNIEQ